MSLEPALVIYINEAFELLAEMEETLLQLEHQSDTQEGLNSIFRAAHTIKGSAGLFGLGNIVAFTHGVETLLDELRAGQMQLDENIVALLLDCHDHIKQLVGQLEHPATPETEELIEALGADLTRQLAALGAKTQAPASGPPARESAPPEPADEGPASASEHWHISLRFAPQSYRDGLDPLSFLAFLQNLGVIVHLQTMDESLPPLSGLEPETCYLGFEIALQSEAGQQEIEDAFEFIRADSQVRIIPPRSRISEYIDLIRTLPEEDYRLGEILIQCGSLTDKGLEESLAVQSQQAQEAAPAKPLGQILVEETKRTDPAVLEAALEKQSSAQESRNKEAHLIRVDAEKLDQLINLVGELVIAGAGTALQAQSSADTALIESVSVLSALVEDARDAALRLRMVQIGATFNKFQRVVRDMSKELGKEIDLVITGAETELDKTVVEKIGDPLMHLVRNAIDHGIESAEARQAQGKPAKGTLRLNAHHDSGSIVIEVIDDGAGLDKHRILQKATERGIIQEGQALSEPEIFNLVFAPGFSTADSVTNLSGRGVGMDVVKRNINALRGTVELDSELGRGTTCRIRMPLTLAIIDGFHVAVGNTAYVIPLDMVLECVELTEGQGQATRGQNYINLRGQVLPFIRLRELFQLKSAPPRRENVVVVHSGNLKAGLVVDQLLGEFQTVIKPLGGIFAQVAGVGGSTILGNGEVALILDVAGLVQRTAMAETQTTHLAG